MAGLLTLVPRYLPRYGMAPEWARANRPLVVIITGIAIVDHASSFDASVEAQGGAYATGVLVLMTLGRAGDCRRHLALAARLDAVPARSPSSSSTPRVTNMIERPEGIKIASVFILAIVFTSLVSRTLRSTELRVHGFELDDRRGPSSTASRAAAGRSASSPTAPGRACRSSTRTRCARRSDSHHVPPDEPVLFLEIQPGDASEFSDVLRVQGVEVGGHLILRSKSPAIPNAIAALLLYIRDQTGVIPHVYFGWTEGNPITYLLKFLAFGEGDTAPVTREVLRQVEADPHRRPRVHVG